MVLLHTHLHYIDACASLLSSHCQTLFGYLLFNVFLLHNAFNATYKSITLNITVTSILPNFHRLPLPLPGTLAKPLGAALIDPRDTPF
jgi:hypothetical protein